MKNHKKNMQKPQHLLVVNDLELWKYLFEDIKTIGWKIVVFPYSKQDNKLKKTLHRITNNHLTKNKLQKIYQKFVIHEWQLSQNNNTIVLLNPVIPEITSGFMHILKEQYNTDIYLLFIDSLRSFDHEYIKSIMPVVDTFSVADKVYTYDSRDALQMGWKFTQQYYSAHFVPRKEQTKDVFLVLFNKGRAERAVRYYDFLEANHIKCLFYISGVNEEFAKTHERDGIIYNTIISYAQIIEFVSSSRVIMELCQEGQSSNTLRTFEAVVYNKKLITDNSNINSFSYYNPKYMKYFSNIEDLKRIDTGFFTTDDILPNYNYSNDFSPIKLFGEICSFNEGENNE